MRTHKVKISIATMNKYLSANAPCILRDTEVPGLYLRIGQRSVGWYLDYKLPGLREDGRRHPSQSIKIGTSVSHNVQEARREAARLKVAVASGDDPAADKRDRKTTAAAERSRATTLEDEVELYISNDLRGSHHHVRSEAGSLRLGLREMGVGALEPTKIQTRDIQKMLAKHHGRACARHRYGAWSRFCEHLILRDLMHANPCQRIPKKDRPKPPPARMRFYTALEVQALSCASNELGEPHGRFLRAIIHVPLRIDELAELHVSDVDLERQCLMLPGKRTKNGDPFQVPVPSVGLSNFTSTQDNLDARVFQLAQRGGHFSGFSKFRSRIRDASGISDFKFHDLRRTLVTTLAELGVGDALLADALLNHRQSETMSGVKGVYNRARLWPQKVRMMEAWGTLVAHAVETGRWTSDDTQENVAPLHGRR